MYSSASNYYFQMIRHFLVVALMLSSNSLVRGESYDYGFIAYLFCIEKPSVKCTGAIVSPSWILDFCEYGECHYDAIRVGVLGNIEGPRLPEFTYNIDVRITHPEYQTQPFPQINSDYDLRSLYASRHAIFLEHTSVEMIMIAGLVRPINLSRSKELPPKARAFFFPKLIHKMKNPIPSNKTLFIVDKRLCNRYFQRYNLRLHRNQFCVDSRIVEPDECCGSHSIMEFGNKLIGIAAWSTACWAPPELWVQTTIGKYYEWITNITSDDPLFPKTRPKYYEDKRTKLLRTDSVLFEDF